MSLGIPDLRVYDWPGYDYYESCRLNKEAKSISKKIVAMLKDTNYEVAERALKYAGNGIRYLSAVVGEPTPERQS